jgi:hypothetical protein
MNTLNIRKVIVTTHGESDITMSFTVGFSTNFDSSICFEGRLPWPNRACRWRLSVRDT